MSNVILEKDEKVYDRMLKQRELLFRLKIKFHATPASKGHLSDLASAAILRTQGKTAEADAIEDLSAIVTAANDANGIFSVILDANKIGSVDKVHSASFRDLIGSSTAVIAIRASAEGNIILDFDSSVDLSAADLDYLVSVKYIKS